MLEDAKENEYKLSPLHARSEDTLKREIQNILDGYHYYWDPLVELLQNASDAVVKAEAESAGGRYFVCLSVNAAEGSIEVFDNGIGISADRLSAMLSPSGVTKSDEMDSVGEEGVGLTYAIFCANHFEIETKVAEADAVCGEVRDAHAWVQTKEGASLPTFDETDKRTTPKDLPDVEFADALDLSYTRVRLSQLSPPTETEGRGLFPLSPSQLKFLLLNQTVVGDTQALFDSGCETPFDFYLRVDEDEWERGCWLPEVTANDFAYSGHSTTS